MPRKGRLHIAGGYYHVMGRGLERRRIFNSDADKQDFLNRLGDCLDETDIGCPAWSLMSNNYHLLLCVGTVPLSQLMRKLLGGYATGYNRRHHRAGYVFQDRYKSILCDEESYFLELVRYIHLNPIRAKLVTILPALDRYPWTGHAGLLGRHQQDWQDTQAVLSRFGGRLATARQRYRAFIEQGLGKPGGPDLSGGGLIRSYGGWQDIQRQTRGREARVGDERILGDSQFVQSALKEDALQMDEQTRLRQAGWDLEGLIDYLCEHYEVDKAFITTKGRANNLSIVKGLVCYLGMSRFGISSTVLSVRLGMSQPAVSKAARRGRAYCREQGVEFEFS